MRKVVVLTTEPLPLPGCATTGAGLRAWGLAEGLRAEGFELVVAAPYYEEKPPEPVEGFAHVRHFRRSAIGEFLEAEAPEVVVLQHWGMAGEVPELSVPLVIDLAGPHLLERLYWGGGNFEANLAEKLSALRRADLVICSGHFQRHYFYPFLAMAGFDLRKDPVAVIPFSVPPPGWEKQAYGTGGEDAQAAEREPYSFVYGGAFLAWQDPTLPIRWLLEEMERAGRGKLYFYGGSHPVIDASGGKFAELADQLKKHKRVEMRGFRGFDQLLGEYRHYSVALDLMAFNPERELAFTTRTMIYLYCGLPVLYNNYSELSSVVREARCGWGLSPDDETKFRQVVRSILEGEAPLEQMRANTRLLSEGYAWDKTITPLAEFCRRPFIRQEKLAAALAHEAMPRELERARRERDEARRELETLQGKLLMRLQRRLPSLAAPLAPVAYGLMRVVAFWLWIRFRKTTKAE